MTGNFFASTVICIEFIHGVSYHNIKIIDLYISYDAQSNISSIGITLMYLSTIINVTGALLYAMSQSNRSLIA